MPISHIRPVCPAPASPVPRMGPACTFPPGRPGLPVRLVCGRFPDASGNVELGALALLDAVGVGDLAPGVATWLHDEVMGDKADRATTLAGYGILDAYTRTETDAAVSRAISTVVDSAPEAFDTLKEIADWIADGQSGAAKIVSDVSSLQSNKVDKVVGKGLSTNDYTTAEKDKLGGVEAGAQANVKPDWDAASGSAAEILNKPATMPPSAHTHAQSAVTGLADALAARPTKAQMDAGWWSEWTVSYVLRGVTNISVSETTAGGDPVMYFSFDYGGSRRGTYGPVDVSEFTVTGGYDELPNETLFTVTRHKVCAPVPTKPSDIGAQPAGDYLTQHQQLAPVYSDGTPQYSWEITGYPDGWSYFEDPQYEGDGQWLLEITNGEGETSATVSGAESATVLAFDFSVDFPGTTVTATRTCTNIIGYTLGNQTTKPLQPQGDYQPALGFTPENASNKVTSLSPRSTNTQYPSAKAVYDEVAGRAAGMMEGVTEFVTSQVNATSGDFTYRPTGDADVWRLYKKNASGVYVALASGSALNPVLYLVWVAGLGKWKAGSTPENAGTGDISGGSATYDAASITLSTGGGVTVATLSRVQSPVALGREVADAREAAADAQTLAGDAFGLAGQAREAAAAAADGLRYDLLANATAISSASSEVVEGETVTYGEVTLLDRTVNRVVITAAIDELRLTFPAAVNGKVRDFGLRVEVGTGSAALTAPSVSTAAAVDEMDSPVVFENPDGVVLPLANGTASAPGVTVLYFTETAPGRFLVKGDQLQEVL